MKPSTMYVIACVILSVAIGSLAGFLCYTWNSGTPLFLLIFAGGYSGETHLKLVKAEREGLE